MHHVPEGVVEEAATERREAAKVVTAATEVAEEAEQGGLEPSGTRMVGMAVLEAGAAPARMVISSAMAVPARAVARTAAMRMRATVVVVQASAARFSTIAAASA